MSAGMWTRCYIEPRLLFSVIPLSYSFLQTFSQCPLLEQQKQLMEKECTYTQAQMERQREREGEDTLAKREGESLAETEG